jgi:hypothetical protein
MTLVFTADDAALGLVAFSLLMWATLPWAFSELVERLLKAEDLAGRYSHKELKAPSHWLENGTTGFSVSGFLYLLTVLVDIAKPNISLLSDFNSGVIFAAATLFFVIALYYTRLVIGFVLRPERLPNTFFEGIEVKTWGDLLVPTTFGLLDVFFLYSLYPVSYLINPSILSGYGQALLASLILSLVGIVMLIALRKKEHSRLNGVATILLFLPIAVLFYVGFGGLF